MSKFTPGPWLVTHGTAVYALNDNDVNQFYTGIQGNGRHGAERDELKANAHLIASAPDMYRALEGLISVIPESIMPFIQGDIDFAQGALAKARGES